jgi:hypothetical protein
MSTVEASELPSLHTFVRGLRNDLPGMPAELDIGLPGGEAPPPDTRLRLPIVARARDRELASARRSSVEIAVGLRLERPPATATPARAGQPSRTSWSCSGTSRSCATPATWWTTGWCPARACPRGSTWRCGWSGASTAATTRVRCGRRSSTSPPRPTSPTNPVEADPRGRPRHVRPPHTARPRPSRPAAAPAGRHRDERASVSCVLRVGPRRGIQRLRHPASSCART